MREKRIKALAEYGSIEKAFNARALEQFQDISVSEAIVLGLYNQGVKKYFYKMFPGIVFEFIQVNDC